jgi:hypothetical protein
MIEIWNNFFPIKYPTKSHITADINPMTRRIARSDILELREPANNKKNILPLGIPSCPKNGINNRTRKICSWKNDSILMLILESI